LGGLKQPFFTHKLNNKMAKPGESVAVMGPNGHTIYVTCTQTDSNGNPTAVVNSLGTRFEKPSTSSSFQQK
jgi:hypothetical protein